MIPPIQPALGDVLETIGNTPMVEIRNLDTGPCRLFVKLESQNPGGSIKDRIALSMIEAAEREGKIRPGGTLVEATAGNTGLGLALVAARKGYRLLLVIPDKTSQEKLFHLKAMGAEIVMTRSDVGKGHPDYYLDKAQRLAKEMDNAFYVNQFRNPANPLAHRNTTGPEIWAQMEQDLDAVVCGVGSGGTITGLSQFFAETAPQVEMVLADPEGSVLANYIRFGKLSREVGSWLVEGIGDDFLPAICDLSRVSRAYTIDDAEAFAICREVLRKEGILAGTSSGTLIGAALHYCRSQSRPKRVVTFVCDSGNKYLSTVYNDDWMMERGFIHQKTYGDLRDLIPRRQRDQAIVCVAPQDSVLTAYSRMKFFDFSQLPVMENGQIVGLVDEEDILLNVFGDEQHFKESVANVMTRDLRTVRPSAPLASLLPLFDRGMVAIVKEGDEFLGMITRIDLLNYLRRRMQ